MRIKMTDEIRQYFNSYISTCCAILRWTNFTAKLETVDDFDVRQLISSAEHLVTKGQQLQRHIRNSGVPKVYIDDFGREVTFEQQFVQGVNSGSYKDNTDQ